MLSARLFCVIVRLTSAADTGLIQVKMKTIREKKKGSTEVRYLSVPVKFTWPSLSVSEIIAELYANVPWTPPPQLAFEVA